MSTGRSVPLNSVNQRALMAFKLQSLTCLPIVALTSVHFYRHAQSQLLSLGKLLLFHCKLFGVSHFGDGLKNCLN